MDAGNIIVMTMHADKHGNSKLLNECTLPLTKETVHDPEGLVEHCKVAALILEKMARNPHTKHHIRSAVREATLKVTQNKGSGKNKASLVSVAALKQIRQGDRTNLVLEHVVPVSQINKLVLALPGASFENICEVVCNWTILSVITKSEHQTLSKFGLGKEMPDNLDESNKFARYEKAGITLEARLYKDL